jgi:hypothetical protein
MALLGLPHQALACEAPRVVGGVLPEEFSKHGLSGFFKMVEIIEGA